MQIAAVMYNLSGRLEILYDLLIRVFNKLPAVIRNLAGKLTFGIYRADCWDLCIF